MSELKKVIYKGDYKGNVFDIYCWDGTPLGHVWNVIKSLYLPGDKVTVTDNYNHTKTFTKGLC